MTSTPEQEAKKLLDKYKELQRQQLLYELDYCAKNNALLDLQNRIDLLNELFFEVTSEQFEFEEILKSKRAELELQKSALETL